MKVGDLVSMIGRQDTVGFVLDTFRSREKYALGVEHRRVDMIRIVIDGTTRVFAATYFEVISESR
jgi:hypothetical protein|tara:strand:+ start:2647 stop:2841 length:195 start_codon:yes stop_codon:yes gene_type:complete